MGKSTIILLFLTFLIGFSRPIKANYCGRLFDNLTSPVCTDARYIFWTGTIATIGLRLVKDRFVDQLQQEIVNKNHLRDNWGEFGGDVGYGYLNAAYFLGNLFFGGKDGNKRAEHMLEATMYTLGTTVLLKDQIHETRPGYPDDHLSFPSGHSSVAFAFASVVTANHGWVWGGITHLMASFIAFSRMDENWHYLHDVVAGMTLGMSYGWGIYFNHKQHSKPYWFGFRPVDDFSGMALTYSYQF